MLNCNNLSQARSQHLHGMEGGGVGCAWALPALNSERRRCENLPPGNFEKMGYPFHAI